MTARTFGCADLKGLTLCIMPAIIPVFCIKRDIKISNQAEVHNVQEKVEVEVVEVEMGVGAHLSAWRVSSRLCRINRVVLRIRLRCLEGQKRSRIKSQLI